MTMAGEYLLQHNYSTQFQTPRLGLALLKPRYQNVYIHLL